MSERTLAELAAMVEAGLRAGRRMTSDWGFEDDPSTEIVRAQAAFFEYQQRVNKLEADNRLLMTAIQPLADMWLKFGDYHGEIAFAPDAPDVILWEDWFVKWLPSYIKTGNHSNELWEAFEQIEDVTKTEDGEGKAQ